MRKRIGWLIIAAVGFTFSEVSVAADFSVQGVRLGMTQTEVAKAIGPGYHTYKVIRYKDAPSLLVTGLLGTRPAHDAFEALSVTYINGKVVEVGFQITYFNQLPTTATFRSAVAEKYGKGTDVDQFHTEWFFDANGQSKSPPAHEKLVECEVAGPRSASVDAPPNFPGLTNQVSPLIITRWDQSCGAHLELNLYPTGNADQYVGAYKIELTDEGPGAAVQAQANANLNATARARQEQANKIKPPL